MDHAPRESDSAGLDSQGFEIVDGVLTHDECDSIAAQVSLAAPAVAGTRNLLAEPWCRALVRTLLANEAIARLVPAGHVAAQCTYFEKSVGRNWLVPVHQDLSIPVANRVEDPYLAGWSHKEGALFVQPPDSLLSELLAVRLHLDDCGPLDGPLRVVPGSHRQGRIDPQLAPAIRKASSEISCEADRGAALLMRPLLLHASSKSSGNSRRRVLHFLFGPGELPCGLQWQQAVRP